jgi:hypothetical protein
VNPNEEVKWKPGWNEVKSERETKEEEKRGV